MFTIYFDTRKLIVCDDMETPLKDPNNIIYSYSNSSDIKELPLLMRDNTNIKSLYIPTGAGMEQSVYKNICSEFVQINAGGGLVENENGEYLLIYRNGYWDLPKGKQEPGEDIRNSALREVGEECGLHNLELRELICITNHTYMLRGLFMLKHTYWYKMRCKSHEAPVPQTEENITKCIWVKPQELEPYMHKTYPSIIEVMRNA